MPKDVDDDDDAGAVWFEFEFELALAIEAILAARRCAIGTACTCAALSAAMWFSVADVAVAAAVVAVDTAAVVVDESEEDCAFSASRKRVRLAAAALASVFAAKPTFSAFKLKRSAARGGAPEEDETVVLLPRRARVEGASADDNEAAAESKSANSAREEDGDADRDTGAEPAPPSSEPCACV
jgi:hypothetical protein